MLFSLSISTFKFISAQRTSRCNSSGVVAYPRSRIIVVAVLFAESGQIGVAGRVVIQSQLFVCKFHFVDNLLILSISAAIFNPVFMTFYFFFEFLN